MELTDDQKFINYAKQCGHFRWNTLLPYEFEFTFIAFGYNVIKRKRDWVKFQGKK